MLTVEIITRFERTFRFISDDSEYTEKLIELLKKIMKVCPKSNYVWSIWSENEKIQYKHINNTITYIYNPNCFREAVELFKDGKNSLQQCNPIAGLFKCKAAVDEIKKYYSIFDRSDYLLCINYEMRARAYLIFNDILSALIAWKKSIDISFLFFVL